MPSVKHIHRNHRVEFVEDLRAQGKGIQVTVRQGWTFEDGKDQRTKIYSSVNEVSRNLPNDIYIFKEN